MIMYSPSFNGADVPECKVELYWSIGGHSHGLVVKAVYIHPMNWVITPVI